MQVAQVTFAGTRYLTANAASDAPRDIADSLLAQFQDAATNTRKALDMESVLAAADAISTANLLAAFGAGGTSSMISDEMQNRFFRLGLRTVSVTDHAMQLMQAATMRTGDVIIASSVSGRNLQMARALEAAKTYGAIVIALTRPGRPVADLADITIAIDLPEGDNILRPSTSRYAFLFVTDLLATLVAMRRGDEARENLRRVKYQLSNTRDPDDKEASVTDQTPKPVAVVTGAAGDIGMAIAAQLSATHIIAAVDIDMIALEGAVESLETTVLILLRSNAT